MNKQADNKRPLALFILAMILLFVTPLLLAQGKEPDPPHPLDDKKIYRQTPTSDHYKGNDSRVAVLYSFPINVREDYQWKRWDEARSLMVDDFHSYQIKYLKQDKNLNITILDFNATSVSFNLSMNSGLRGTNVPIVYWELNRSKDLNGTKITERNYKDFYIQITNRNVTQLVENATYIERIAVSEILQIGSATSIITLDSTNIDLDGTIDNPLGPPSRDGPSDNNNRLLVGQSQTGNQEFFAFIQWNTSSIPDTATIVNVSLNVTVSTSSAESESYNITALNLTRITNTTAYPDDNDGNINLEANISNGEPIGRAYRSDFNDLDNIDGHLLSLSSENSDAIEDLQGNLNRDFFSFGIKCNTCDDSPEDISGINSSTASVSNTRPNLLVEYTINSTGETNGNINFLINETRVSTLTTSSTTDWTLIASIHKNNIATDREYLLWGTFGISASGGSSRCNYRVVGDNGVEVLGLLEPSGSTDHAKQQDYVRRYTSSSDPGNVSIEFKKNAGGGDCSSTNSMLLMIELTNLTENVDWFYGENNTEFDVTSTIQDTVTLTLDDADGNKDWFTLGSLEYQVDNAGDFEMNFLMNGDGSNDMLLRMEGEDAADDLNAAMFKTYDDVPQDQEVSIGVTITSGTSSTVFDHVSSALFILNLNVFESHSSVYGDDFLVMGGSMSQMYSLSHVAVTEGQHLFFSDYIIDHSRAHNNWADELTVAGIITPANWDWTDLPTEGKTNEDSEDLSPNNIFGNVTMPNFPTTLSQRGDDNGPGSLPISERSLTVFSTLLTVQSGDTTPPTVVVLAPLADARVNGNVSMSAMITDNVGVQNVTFFAINATSTTELCFFTAPTGPDTYTCVGFNTSEFSNSTEGYDLTYNATDFANNIGGGFINVVIDRILPVFKDENITYGPGGISARNGSTVTIGVNVSDAPEFIAAGINITQIDLSNVNGSGNESLIFQSGSTAADEWSFWEITFNIANITSGLELAQLYIHDNATPNNNVNLGPAIFVQIDNDEPTSSSFTNSGDTDEGENFIWSADFADNFQLQNYTCHNNISVGGGWTNGSEQPFTPTTTDSASCSIAMVEGFFSFQIIGYDDAGNVNSTAVGTVTGNPVGGDSCTPPAIGLWTILWSDNCTIVPNDEDVTVVPGNISIISPPGNVTIASNLSFQSLGSRINALSCSVPLQCNIKVTQGASIGEPA